MLAAPALDNGLTSVQRGVSRNTIAEDILALTGQLGGFGTLGLVRQEAAKLLP